MIDAMMVGVSDASRGVVDANGILHLRVGVGLLTAGGSILGRVTFTHHLILGNGLLTFGQLHPRCHHQPSEDRLTP